MAARFDSLAYSLQRDMQDQIESRLPMPSLTTSPSPTPSSTFPHPRRPHRSVISWSPERHWTCLPLSSSESHDADGFNDTRDGPDHLPTLPTGSLALLPATGIRPQLAPQPIQTCGPPSTSQCQDCSPSIPTGDVDCQPQPGRPTQPDPLYGHSLIHRDPSPASSPPTPCSVGVTSPNSIWSIGSPSSPVGPSAVSCCPCLPGQHCCGGSQRPNGPTGCHTTPNHGDGEAAISILHHPHACGGRPTTTSLISSLPAQPPRLSRRPRSLFGGHLERHLPDFDPPPRSSACSPGDLPSSPSLTGCRDSYPSERCFCFLPGNVGFPCSPPCLYTLCGRYSSSSSNLLPPYYQVRSPSGLHWPSPPPYPPTPPNCGSLSTDGLCQLHPMGPHSCLSGPFSSEPDRSLCPLDDPNRLHPNDCSFPSDHPITASCHSSPTRYPDDSSSLYGADMWTPSLSTRHFPQPALPTTPYLVDWDSDDPRPTVLRLRGGRGSRSPSPVRPSSVFLSASPPRRSTIVRSSADLPSRCRSVRSLVKPPPPGWLTSWVSRNGRLPSKQLPSRRKGLTRPAPPLTPRVPSPPLLPRSPFARRHSRRRTLIPALPSPRQLTLPPALPPLTLTLTPALTLIWKAISSASVLLHAHR